MSGGRIHAVAVTLLDEAGRSVARGVVPVDAEEGAPPAIFWQGELYLPTDAVLHRYRKTRAMFAGSGFLGVAL